MDTADNDFDLKSDLKKSELKQSELKVNTATPAVDQQQQPPKPPSDGSKSFSYSSI